MLNIEVRPTADLSSSAIQPPSVKVSPDQAEIRRSFNLSDREQSLILWKRRILNRVRGTGERTRPQLPKPWDASIARASDEEAAGSVRLTERTESQWAFTLVAALARASERL